ASLALPPLAVPENIIGRLALILDVFDRSADARSLHPPRRRSRTSPKASTLHWSQDAVTDHGNWKNRKKEGQKPFLFLIGRSDRT
ncbi:MAG: hypothetical protein IKV35_01890, partial [Clostridia bacterium]|nr:hypothetical protein [Clostridia bacterium]